IQPPRSRGADQGCAPHLHVANGGEGIAMARELAHDELVRQPRLVDDPHALVTRLTPDGAKRRACQLQVPVSSCVAPCHTSYPSYGASRQSAGLRPAANFAAWQEREKTVFEAGRSRMLITCRDAGRLAGRMWDP